MEAFAHTYLDIELNIKRFPNNNGNQDWVDPHIGIRIILDITRGWSMTLGETVGGFVVGSDFVWTAAGLLGYRFGFFGEDNAGVLGAYRAMYQDYSSGSGDDKFEWDVTLHGPIPDLSIEF